MTNHELIARFEDGTIAPGAFGHREHLRLAWLYLRRHGRPEAEPRLLAGLRALASRAGQPEKFNAALTLAWVAHIDAASAALAPDHSFDDLLLHSPQLLDRRSVREMAQTL